MARCAGVGRLSLLLAILGPFVGAGAVPAATPVVARPPPPQARPILPLEQIPTNPEWARRPSGEDVIRFYPTLARAIQLSGRATLSCQVARTGDLQGCAALDEAPAGFGFGAAAVAMAGLFRMTPRTMDGRPTEGGAVKIPIRFSVAAPVAATPPAAAPVGGAAPPSAETLAQARRLAAATVRADGWRGAIMAYLASLTGAPAADSMSQEQALATQALEQAKAALDSALRERMAQAYAASIPPRRLARILAFIDSPAGRDWLAATGGVEDAVIASQTALQNPVMLDARARLCRQIACLDSDRAAAQGVPSLAPPRSGPAPGGGANP
jgi:TonB family protein